MDNRQKLGDLLDHSGITQKAAAELIAEQTMRPCSLRTVQAWLSEPDKPSARVCPDWAILALETRLKLMKTIT